MLSYVINIFILLVLYSGISIYSFLNFKKTVTIVTVSSLFIIYFLIFLIYCVNTFWDFNDSSKLVINYQYYAVNTFVLISLFLLISINFIKNSKLTRTNVFLSSIFLICCLNPYWFYGINSAVGLYDEIDTALINIILISSQGNLNNIFYPQISGGSYIFDTFYLSRLNYSFLSLLFSNFEHYFAAFLYRLSSLLLCLLGFLILAKLVLKLKNINSENYFFFIFFCALLTIFTFPAEYGWTLAGLNFTCAAIIWLLVLILYVQTSLSLYLLIFLFSFVISFLGVGIIYFIPANFAAYLVLILFLDKKIDLLKLIKIFSFLYFWLLLFNLDALINLSNMGSRFLDGSVLVENNQILIKQKTNIAKAWDELVGIFYFFSRGFDVLKNTWFYQGSLFPAFMYINSIFFCFIFISSFMRKDFYHLKLIIISTFVIILLSVFKHFLPYPFSVFSSYQFTVILIYLYIPFYLILLVDLIYLFENLE